MRRLTRVLPALLLSTGCLATRNDVRLLQDELRIVRYSAARADTARRAQTDTVAMLIGRANDSLHVLSARLATFQANANGQLLDLGRQVLQVQELTGQTQRRIQEMRAQLEARQEEIAASTAATPAAGGAPGDTAARPAGPGPAQLFQIGSDQMSRGSFGAARTAFQQLLDRYPTFDEAPAAQAYVGEAFAREGNTAAADSVYQLVATKYPRSNEAASALYKRALLLRGARKTAEAKALLQRVVKDYPRSDAAQLARDLLATMR